jgi:hypothetical protein
LSKPLTACGHSPRCVPVVEGRPLSAGGAADVRHPSTVPGMGGRGCVPLVAPVQPHGCVMERENPAVAGLSQVPEEGLEPATRGL